MEFKSPASDWKLLAILFCGDHSDEGVNHSCAMTEEQGGKYRYYDQAAEGGKSGPLPSFGYAFDIRPVLNEKRLETLLLRLAPTVLGTDLRSNFARRNASHECGYLLRELRRLVKRARHQEMDGEGDQDQEKKIRFRNVRPSE